MNKSFKIISILFLITCLFFITSCNNQSDKATYTVTFKDYDGTLLKEEIIEEGTAATPPQNLTKEGYTFLGWSTPSNDIPYLDITKVNVKNDLHFIANWSNLEFYLNQIMNAK